MEDLYNKYHKGVRAFISKRIDDEGVVEELTNDTMLAAIRSWPSFNRKSNEFSWICAIARHKIVDYFRKKRIKTVLFSSHPLFEEIADKALTPERDCLKNELKAEVEDTLRELSEGYGKILRLKYIDGLKVSQIAEALKLSIKAVESKLMRAKKKFKLTWNYNKNENREDT